MEVVGGLDVGLRELGGGVGRIIRWQGVDLEQGFDCSGEVGQVEGRRCSKAVRSFRVEVDSESGYFCRLYKLTVFVELFDSQGFMSEVFILFWGGDYGVERWRDFTSRLQCGDRRFRDQT